MSFARRYFVYILSSEHGVLYAGVTNDLIRRIQQHRRPPSGFTRRYRVGRLVYFEETDDTHAALAREKQIKGWRRKKKLGLIRTMKPSFRDLAQDLE